jgi:replicative DNA helicase
VLGAILIDNESMNVAAAMIDRRRSFAMRTAASSTRCSTCRSAASRSTLVTLKEELERSGDLEEVGGPAYIASLVDGVPRSTNVEYYAQIVKEKATLRNLIFSANKILGSAYEADQEADLILDEAESSIFAVAEDRIKSGFVSMSTLVREKLPEDREAVREQDFITGVPTGFDDIDRKTRGLQPGDL